MKDPKTHNIVFILFCVYKKNHEDRKNKDDMQNNKRKGLNGLDSPEKKKKGKRRRKNRKRESGKGVELIRK
jgi:hypothetical protein